jgi:hypothetical protein
MFFASVGGGGGSGRGVYWHLAGKFQFSVGSKSQILPKTYPRRLGGNLRSAEFAGI